MTLSGDDWEKLDERFARIYAQIDQSAVRAREERARDITAHMEGCPIGKTVGRIKAWAAGVTALGALCIGVVGWFIKTIFDHLFAAKP